MNRYFRAIKRVISDPAAIKYYCVRCISILKAWAAYLAVLANREKLYSQKIWLVMEKGTEARDNGYWFFRYIKEEQKKINAFFVISKDSADIRKLEKYKDSIVFLNSFRHYIYSLAAKVSASSQPYGAFPSPTEVLYMKTEKLRRTDQVVVFLRHGIVKDELPHTLDYSNTHFDLLCCTCDTERAFVQKMHGYPDENIKTVGLCRFDNLLHAHHTEKQILIMPTHRMWLHSANTAREATDKGKKAFEASEYYSEYSSLLSDSNFTDYIRKHGYRIVFYLHYALQSYISCFEKFSNDVITIANRKKYDVQQLLMESAALITDYSSIFFDFAYMGKPVVYFQFDEKKFQEGHFKKGYFEYGTDGFGPVCDNRDGVIREIRQLVDNDCIMSSEYTRRVNAFFTTRDTNNCSRAFAEVLKKAEEK